MSGIFSPEGKLYQFMSRLTDVVKLNLLWILFSLPIVTMGAATIAAFSVTLKMVEDNEGRIAHSFVKEFKANLKQGIPMSFISIICVWALYIDFQIAALEDSSIVYLIIGIIAAYVFTFSLLYVYPLLARYENTLLASIRNSFRISMKYFLRSVLLVLLVAVELALIFWDTKTVFVGVLIGPVFIMYTISWIAMKNFRDLEKIPGTVAQNDETEEYEKESAEC